MNGVQEVERSNRSAPTTHLGTALSVAPSGVPVTGPSGGWRGSGDALA